MVLITTKRGKSGRASISLNTCGGFMERTRKLDMLNGEERVDRVILGLPADQVNTGFLTDDRWVLLGHPGLNCIDWQEQTLSAGRGAKPSVIGQWWY